MSVDATMWVRSEGSLYQVTANADQLAELYAAHASAAARLAYLLTGNRDLAEDIAQEAFARLGGRLFRLRDPERAAGYLYRTVTNLARGHGRWLRRQRELKQRLASPSPQGAPDVGTRDEVWQGLMALPVRQRTVLFLRHYLDLSEAHAAEVLNCSVPAVKSLTHRAADSLRKHLQGADA